VILRRVAITLMVGIAGGMPGAIVAQQADLLRVPAPDVMMCRELPAARDTAAVRLEWNLDDGRIVRTTFDSSGAPAALAIRVPDPRTGRDDAAVVIEFDSVIRGTVWQRSRGAGALPLPAADTGRARALAVWFWERRCTIHRGS
jgi:hypothetical protein